MEINFRGAINGRIFCRWIQTAFYRWPSFQQHVYHVSEIIIQSYVCAVAASCQNILSHIVWCSRKRHWVDDGSTSHHHLPAFEGGIFDHGALHDVRIMAPPFIRWAFRSERCFVVGDAECSQTVCYWLLLLLHLLYTRLPTIMFIPWIETALRLHRKFYMHSKASRAVAIMGRTKGLSQNVHKLRERISIWRRPAAAIGCFR